MTRTLEDALEALRSWLREHGVEMPDLVMVLELPTAHGEDVLGRSIAASSDFITVHEYAGRFVELVEQRPPWINVSYVGARRGSALVTIEASPPRTNRRTHGSDARRASINYSGPPRGGIESVLVVRDD